MNADPQTVREFLVELRRRMAGAGQQSPLPAAGDLREVVPGDDLVARFRIAAETAGCRVYRSSDQDWLAVVRHIVADHGAHSVLIEPQPETALDAERAAALQVALTADGIAATEDRTDESLFSVDVAVTGVESAVAETGTLMCVSGADSARGATLIPLVHIALVAGSQILGDLFDLFAQLGAGRELPAAVSWITGPSKTADIEGVLVTGVHGPGEVHIVIV